MFRFPDYMQLHECPTRVIVTLVREAFRLLWPGGTLDLTDFLVYKVLQVLCLSCFIVSYNQYINIWIKYVFSPPTFTLGKKKLVLVPIL